MDIGPSSDELLCRRCGRPIVSDHGIALDIFEGMHWICFHFEFEHSGDPDQQCSDPDCPWRRIEFYKSALARAGIDPKAALDAEMKVYFRSLVKASDT